MANMLNTSPTYSDAPITPLGHETGITSTPVSELPSRGSTPRPNPHHPSPYHYQPAIHASRPELVSLHRNSTNYAQAHSESLKLDQQDSSYSFSPEDLKRSKYHHLMKDGTAGKKKEGE